MGHEVERITNYFYAGDMVVLTAGAADIARGFLLGPDGYKVLLSPKNKVGYQYTYRPTPKEGGWPLTHES